MKYSTIVDGEAMSAVEGVDVTHLIGNTVVIDMQRDPQRAAFNAYRLAFNVNASDPNLHHAAALVRAWNVLADIVGVNPV